MPFAGGHSGTVREVAFPETVGPYKPQSGRLTHLGQCELTVFGPDQALMGEPCDEPRGHAGRNPQPAGETVHRGRAILLVAGVHMLDRVFELDAFTSAYPCGQPTQKSVARPDQSSDQEAGQREENKGESGIHDGTLRRSLGCPKLNGAGTPCEGGESLASSTARASPRPDRRDRVHWRDSPKWGPGPSETRAVRRYRLRFQVP